MFVRLPIGSLMTSITMMFTSGSTDLKSGLRACGASGTEEGRGTVRRAEEAAGTC